MLRGMQGCSERQARGLAAAGGYASVNISPLRFMGCCQLWHRGCSNPSPPELVASRQRESFPWKKIFSEGSQKEISARGPARTPIRWRDVYTFCLLNRSHPGSPCPPGSSGRAEKGKALGMLDELSPRRVDERRSCSAAPHLLPAAQPGSETPSRGSFSAFQQMV